MMSVNLAKTDQQLYTINQKISFFAITPLNVKEEKEKFFASTTYNPQFRYEPYITNLEIIRRELTALKTDASVIGKLLNEKRQHYLKTLGLLATRGLPQFSQYSCALHGVPDTKLVSKAKQLVHFQEHPEKKTLTTHEIMNKLSYALMKYGVHWKVKEKEMVAYAAVSPNKKCLLIKKNTKFSEQFLKRLIVHEIGTHIIRAENGLRQPYKLFFYGFPDYLTTEEGLCVVNEQLNGCLNNATLKNYAGRVLAIHYALHFSFRATFQHLRKYFDDDLAWKLTLRAKRGSGDTSIAGAFTKDHAYLKGYLAMKEYWYKYRDLTPLYYGRVSLEHLHHLPKIPGLVHPKSLPTLRYLSFALRNVASLCREVVRAL